jgi:hypothetical protein
MIACKALAFPPVISEPLCVEPCDALRNVPYRQPIDRAHGVCARRRRLDSLRRFSLVGNLSALYLVIVVVACSVLDSYNPCNQVRTAVE